VLLIEDNADARETLRALLEAEGHRVDEAVDGAAGLARAETARPDIALIDIGLPGIDGYEVARRLRARLGARPILVAISGYGQLNDRLRSLAAGFDAHLTKPVAADNLAATLATLSRARR
jgi:CheY-like chemotaxis protein